VSDENQAGLYRSRKDHEPVGDTDHATHYAGFRA
jgi:hypothetical protein